MRRATVLITWAVLAVAGCQPAGVQVVSIQDRGTLEQDDSIKARDGGYSALFEGHSVWTYGDSILALAGEDGSSWRNNTASWTTDLDATDGITGFDQWTDGLGAPTEFLPRTAAEAAFNAEHSGDDCIDPCGARYAVWPAAMVVDPNDGRALVFYDLIYGEPGEWNFHSVGRGIATWDGLDQAPERPETRPDSEFRTTLWDPAEPAFGAAAVVHDGLVYAYGCDAEDWTAKTCKLGRVAPADALDRDAWTYWDGAGWSADVDEAATVFEGSSQMSVHHSEHLDRFVAIYIGGIWGEVVLRTADTPEGPWSAELSVFETEPAANDSFTYCGMAHPEYAVDGGRVEVVTYYRSTGDWTGEIRVVDVELGLR